MANRLRTFVESVVFAGMKPAVRSSQAAPAVKRGLFARLFPSAPDASDPLYLSNQTFGQRVRRLLLFAGPVLTVVALAMVVIVIYASRNPKIVKALTPAEVAEKVLPGFNKDFKLESNKEIEVMEVHFEHAGGAVMVGNLRNATDRVIADAELVFDLTDENRSQLGGVTVRQISLQPGAVRAFKIAIDQNNAAYAVVREVQTR